MFQLSHFCVSYNFSTFGCYNIDVKYPGKGIQQSIAIWEERVVSVNATLQMHKSQVLFIWAPF